MIVHIIRNYIQMKFYNILSIVALSVIFVVGCKSQKEKFEFVTPQSGQTIVYGEKVLLKMQFPDTTLDSVIYSVDGQVIGRKQDTSTVVLDTQNIGIGTRNLLAKVYVGGKESTAYSNVTVLPETPKQYTFEKVASYPHDTKAFTQGLEYHDGVLYESTGAGNELISSVRKVDVKSGEILQKKEFIGKSDNGQDYFGEGITIVDDKIVFLMWLNNEGLLLNKSNFEQVGAFSYQNSKEGWGICNAGEFLIKSDGSNKLTFLNSKTFQEAHAITVYDSHGPVDAINELEFIEGKIYANIYGKDIIAIIDPQTGVVEGQINLVGLHSAPSQTDKELNGIAFNAATKNLYVTGKQWDKLYEIKVVAR